MRQLLKQNQIEYTFLLFLHTVNQIEQFSLQRIHSMGYFTNSLVEAHILLSRFKTRDHHSKMLPPFNQFSITPPNYQRYHTNIEIRV
jgi:hypothetical protein